MNEETVKAIAAELTKAYLMAHRTVPASSLEAVSASIADAVPAITAQNAHDVFRRAMQVEAIPTVPTLVTAAKNHIAESYRETSNTPSIEYRDPCEAWLPKSDVIKRINLNEAIKNYCIACGGNSYANLCSARARGKEAYEAFTRGIKDTLRNLYTKYWRKCPIANGYPFDAKLNLGLIPPSVDDFRRMFEDENSSFA
jgi:hypothetical protein